MFAVASGVFAAQLQGSVTKIVRTKVDALRFRKQLLSELNESRSNTSSHRRKTCGESTNAMDMPVRVGYYGMWGASRGCDSMQPENIPAGVLTTINLAFAYVSADNEITDEEPGIVARVSRLKKKYEGLRVNIAIGGWVFNDPPTQFRFSNMVSTRPNRAKFISSLVRFIRHYGLNGVDLGMLNIHFYQRLRLYLHD
jgi:GH18 family chitinase